MSESIMQAFGVSPAIFSGDGNAMREARRLMFFDSILPTSALIEGELKTKLETPISISHNESGICRLPKTWSILKESHRRWI